MNEKSPWKFGPGAIDDKKGLWVRVDTREGLHPVMEAFRTWEELGVKPIEDA